jgi:hypothetical protein
VSLRKKNAIDINVKNLFERRKTMKTTKMLTILVVALGLIAFQARVSKAAEMGTAFTYQGHLYDNNDVADGLYDFQFSLYDVNVGGAAVANDVNVHDMDVIDGYFTVELDFNDANAFNGDARWLEIGIRPGDQNDPNAYTELSPRQEITPTPYALHARWLLVDTALDNVFLGEDAGVSNTTGYRNSAMGKSALYSNTTGHGNSAMGYRALYSNTTGPFNSAMGHEALYKNTTGYHNSAVGYNALYGNIEGYFNSAVGYGALRYNTTGNHNSAMGTKALFSNTTGYHNSAVGYSALFSNTTGYHNSAVGYSALYDNIEGYHNSAVGYESLYKNTTGYRNSAMGYQALYYNTTGYRNSAVGYSALYNNIEGYHNSAVGYESLYSNTTGNHNSAMGYQALYYNTTGYRNSAVGQSALRNNTTGVNNSAMGYEALRYNTTGWENSAVGNYALYANTSGNENTAMGYEAGYSNSTGSRNVFLGYKAGFNEAGSNKLYIANDSADANVLIYGNFSSSKVGIGTTNPAVKLHVANGELGVKTNTLYTNGAVVGIGTAAPLDNAGGTSRGALRIETSTNPALILNQTDFSPREWEIHPSAADGALLFRDETAAAYRMAIGPTGNVGIGTTSPDYKLQVNGDVCPETHKGSDLGKSGQAWDNLYYDDAYNEGSAAFTDRIVTGEILQHPPMAKKPGMFDYMTERGLEELDPYSLPEDLHDDSALLTDEMTTYNYKANYEQQVQIEKLLAENEALKQRLEALETIVQQLGKGKEFEL